MRKNELKNIIRKKLREKYRKAGVDEATTTANIDGYQTPHAFSKDDEEEDEDRIDSIIDASGYTRAEDWSPSLSEIRHMIRMELLT